MEFLCDKTIDEMQCGPFNNKSYFGYKTSVLKSGICKYFRREQFLKLEWCVVEMFIMGIKNSGIITNVINRLRILVMEEIVFSEFSSIIECIKLFDEIDKETDLMKQMCIAISIVRVASKCKKGRICSYVNNWWKHNTSIKDKLELNQINKVKKIGDTPELLHYGELMIDYIKNKNENLFGIYTILFDMKGKMGKRYRRTDPVYLYWELIEKYYCYEKRPPNKLNILNNDKKKLFDYALKMFNRKNMKERKAFGIWMGLFVIWGHDISVIPNTISITSSELLKDRIKISIDEDYVVKDFHVNKKFGLSSFGSTGAYVVNEDIMCLGDDHETGISKVLKYREYYQLQKDLQEKKIKDSKVPDFIHTSKIDSNKIDTRYHFRVLKVIEEGVCGLKKCCILVKNLENQKRYVIKEMPKSMNFGIDYLFMDELKQYVGLEHLGMFRVTSRTSLGVVDKTIKSYVGNWTFNHTNKHTINYCVMDYKENIGDLGKHKDILSDLTIKKEMLKIRLFNGLFGTSDNILRNILVGKDKKSLFSIDENDIYGKRKNIFNKNDWCLKDKWCMDNIEQVWFEIINSLDTNLVIEKLKLFGLGSKIDVFLQKIKYTKEDLVSLI